MMRKCRTNFDAVGLPFCPFGLWNHWRNQLEIEQSCSARNHPECSTNGFELSRGSHTEACRRTISRGFCSTDVQGSLDRLGLAGACLHDDMIAQHLHTPMAGTKMPCPPARHSRRTRTGEVAGLSENACLLRKDTPRTYSVGYLGHCQHVGSQPQRHVLLLAKAPHSVKATHHDAF